VTVSAQQPPGGSALALGATNDAEVHESRSASRNAVFVIPCRGSGFRASIRGHLLELADPDAGEGLAPTPEDLLTAAIASDIAWFARRFLRDHGLDDYVSVYASARTSQGPPGLGGLDVTVEVSKHVAAMGTTLAAALERRFAEQSSSPPQFRVSPV
jgi:hypothetical protein